MKTCSTCEAPKRADEFNKDPRLPKGLSSDCKACHYEATKKWLKRNPESRDRARKKYNDAHREEINEKARNTYKNNREKMLKRSRVYQSRWRKENLERMMCRAANQRARQLGVPFALSLKDIRIPDICPVLGIPLVVGKKKPRPGSPSLDRIVPKKGYIPGNVVVISYRANILKRDGTAEEFKLLSSWMDKVLAPSEVTNEHE